jgi:CubicO group peptidase (beta-lactamase class C family)
MDRTGLPGLAAGVVYKNDVIFLKGFGERKLGTGKPVDPDTVFQLASVSKPIASTVIAAAVGRGFVGWDDRLIDHLPGFRLSDPWITHNLRIRDLLCHRSGLPDHAGDLLEDLGYNRTQILHRLRYLQRLGRFRDQYAYTNFGFTAAAEAVARAAGTTWEELSEELLYRPLDMTSTSSRYADYLAAENRAIPHVLRAGSWSAKYQRQPDAQSPAGGVSSSARDMVRYIQLQLGQGRLEGKQLVAEDALAETHAPQVITEYDSASGRASTYGLGWNVGVNPLGLMSWSHSGGFNLGIRSQVLVLPDAAVGIVILTNGAPSGIPEGLTISFMELLLRGETSRDWVAEMNRKLTPQFMPEPRARPLVKLDPPSPPLPLEIYAGRYHNQYYGALEVVVRDGNLRMRLGPEPQVFSLSHWDRDTFLYQPVGENAGDESTVVFSMDGTDRAARVVVEHLDQFGQGSFARQSP